MTSPATPTPRVAEPSIVGTFDTGAVLALLDRNVRLARVLFDASAHDARVAVPITCLREAADVLDRAGRTPARLLTLPRAPVLRIVPAAAADEPMLAATAALIGDECVAHAGITSLQQVCRLFTTRPGVGWPMGLADWQLVTVQI